MKFTRSRDEIIAKADEFAASHNDAYGGCAESTFMAIVDALRWGGLEIITPEVEDAVFPGVQLLSAGIGFSGQGTCGAVSGSVMAIGLALAAARGAKPRDMGTFMEGAGLAQQAILGGFDERYRSQRCLDVQMKRFGKAWDFRRPDMTQEFISITDGCAIRDTARFAAGAIYDAIQE